MRGVALRLSLLAHAIDAVDDRTFLGYKDQVDGEVVHRRLQMVIGTEGLGPPVIIPDVQALLVGAGDAEDAAD